MTTRGFLIAGALAVAILAGHSWLHINLVSVLIAPLVVATWISFLPEPPEWLILVLAIGAELFSGAPAGVMALAVLTPLLVRTLLPSSLVGITVRFLTVVVGVTVAQVALLLVSTGYTLNTASLPWLPAAAATVGTSLAAFVAINVWYEFGVEIKQ